MQMPNKRLKRTALIKLDFELSEKYYIRSLHLERSDYSLERSDYLMERSGLEPLERSDHGTK